MTTSHEPTEDRTLVVDGQTVAREPHPPEPPVPGSDRGEPWKCPDCGALRYPGEEYCYVCAVTMVTTPQERAAEQGKPDRAVTVTMSEVQPERIDWLWPGRLARGKLHILDGDPGLGKSTITAAWAATVSTGGFWPDGASAGSAAGVVILTAEDGLADTIRPRLDAHGADPARVVALTAVRRVDPETGETYEVPPVVPDDLGALESAIGEVGAAMVVVDPLMAYLGPDTNSYRDQDVRRALAPLARLAERTGVAVVIVRHLRKSKGSAVYSGGGSIGIIGAARIGFTVGTDPHDEGRCVLACAKTNIGTKPPSLAYRLAGDELHGCARVVWCGEVAVTADQLTAERDRGDDGALGGAAEWLRGYLEDQGGAAPWSEIKKAGQAAGHSERTLQRARDKAKVTHESGGFPRTTTWKVSDAPQSRQPEPAGALGATGGSGVTRPNAPRDPQSRQYSNPGATGADDCPDCARLRSRYSDDWRCSAHDPDPGAEGQGDVRETTVPGCGCGRPLRTPRDHQAGQCAVCRHAEHERGEGTDRSPVI